MMTFDTFDMYGCTVGPVGGYRSHGAMILAGAASDAQRLIDHRPQVAVRGSNHLYGTCRTAGRTATALLPVC